jgi:hypothetical protein
VLDLNISRTIRVLEFDMSLKFRLTTTLQITEDTVRVFRANMSHQLDLRPKSLPSVFLEGGALIAPESKGTMCTVLVLSQSAGRVKTQVASFFSIWIHMRTDERVESEMLRPDVSLKRLMFPECLRAWRICCTLESFVSLVGILVSSQSRRRQEAFTTALPFALVGLLMRMAALNVLFQVLFLQITLVTTFVAAYEWPLLGMRS